MNNEFICANCQMYFEANPFCDFCCDGCREEYEKKKEQKKPCLRCVLDGEQVDCKGNLLKDEKEGVGQGDLENVKDTIY